MGLDITSASSLGVLVYYRLDGTDISESQEMIKNALTGEYEPLNYFFSEYAVKFEAPRFHSSKALLSSRI